MRVLYNTNPMLLQHGVVIAVHRGRVDLHGKCRIFGGDRSSSVVHLILNGSRLLLLIVNDDRNLIELRAHVVQSVYRL